MLDSSKNRNDSDDPFDRLRDFWFAKIESGGQTLDPDGEWPSLAICVDSILSPRFVVQSFPITDQTKHFYSDLILPTFIQEIQGERVALLISLVAHENTADAIEVLLAMFFSPGREEFYSANIERRKGRHPILTPWRRYESQEVSGLYIDPLRRIFRARLS